MCNKNMKFLIGSIVLNILGLVLIFLALPIEKLSVLWFISFLCGLAAFIVGLYVSEKKILTYLSLLIAVVVMIAFPLTEHINMEMVEKKYKNQKVETLVIPSEFTPVKKAHIYDLVNTTDSKYVLVYFTNGDKKVNLKAEKIIISALANNKNNKRIYYYDISRMPTREVSYVKRHFVPEGNSYVAKIKKGVLAGRVNVKKLKELREFLKRNLKEGKSK